MPPAGRWLHAAVSQQRFIQDPYATTFGGFSKVTNFFKAALRPPDSSGGFRACRDPELAPQPDDEPGFELITCVRQRAAKRLPLFRPEKDLRPFVICEGSGAGSQAGRLQGAPPGPMGGVSGPPGPSGEPREDQGSGVQRGEAAGRRELSRYPRRLPVSSCPGLLQGVAQPLRKELWKFLLGFYPWNSTPKEREDILRSKTLVPTASFPS